MLRRCLLFLPGLLLARRSRADGETPRLRRVEEVAWKPIDRRLEWIIGECDAPPYRPQRFHAYVINMEQATMRFGLETRHFSKQEAANVTILLELIHKYAVESTIWWDQGFGKEPEKPRA